MTASLWSHVVKYCKNFCKVELMLPELEFLNDEGSHEELWELARLYLEETGVQRLKAIFPDAGAAALVKHWWKDASFNFASLSDRKPVEDEDEIIVMISPDYQMLKDVERIASLLSSDLLLFLDDEREGAKEKPSFFVEAMGMFSSFNRFMRSLSK